MTHFWTNVPFLRFILPLEPPHLSFGDFSAGSFCHFCHRTCRSAIFQLVHFATTPVTRRFFNWLILPLATILATHVVFNWLLLPRLSYFFPNFIQLLSDIQNMFLLLFSTFFLHLSHLYFSPLIRHDHFYPTCILQWP